MRVAIVVALCSVGCFSPNYGTHELKCEVGTRNCPPGFHCAPDNRCWLNGNDPLVDMRHALPTVGDMGSASTAPDLMPAGNTNGVACQVDADCASKHCVDGVCCDKACTGQCEACDGNSPGTCSAIQGPPHGTRPACNGAGTSCGGSCDGMTRTQCVYSPATHICGAACDSHCDGNGTCPGGSGACPNGFACGMGNCKTSCSNDNDCQTNFKCMAPNCVRVAESDCLDGLDNNGDGKIDCDDPTCTTVACVSTPGSGNELGLMNQAACTSTGYTTKEPQNQGLSMPLCSGCSCDSHVVCSESIQLFTKNGPSDLNCTSTNYEGYVVASWGFGAKDWCTRLNGSTYYAYKVTDQSYVTASCTPNGMATLADPKWTTSTNFCAAQRISTNNCGGDKTKVCAPKPPAAAKLCVRIPGSGGGCPSGYAGTSGTYYASYQKGTCGSCDGCMKISASCGAATTLALWGDAQCNPGKVESTPDPIVAGTCYTATQTGTLPDQFSGLSYGTDPAENANVMCSAPTVITNPSTAQGPSTICCP